MAEQQKVATFVGRKRTFSPGGTVSPFGLDGQRIDHTYHMKSIKNPTIYVG